MGLPTKPLETGLWLNYELTENSLRKCWIKQIFKDGLLPFAVDSRNNNSYHQTRETAKETTT